MRQFLSDLLSTDSVPRTVVVMDDDSTGAPRQYRVTPARLFYGLIAVAAGLVLGAVALTIFSPLERLRPSYEAQRARQMAERQQVAIDALQDSLRLQREYTLRLRQLMGGVGPGVPQAAGEPAAAARPEVAPVAAAQASWSSRLARREAAGPTSFPALLPAQGVVTRGFDAASGHRALDIAVEEGSPVRVVEDGYVVLADWTHAGGYVIAVQHADGFVSVYKHNSQLLREPGDRVRARDVIALSGNTGEITTGPHVHVELWRDGEALDPAAFLVAL
jgi:murein DD-endopeptidase MepM/ murein hydrolase activator NlpD